MEDPITDDDVHTGRRQPKNSGWGRWVYQIRLTWALALITSVTPAVTHGTVFSSAALVMATVILGLPTGLAAFLVKDKEWRSRIWRRLVVLLLIPVSTYSVLSQIDKMAPSKADPIVQAVVAYKRDTMSYPASLGDITPNYLAEIPAVRLSIVQPKITYTFRDGKPYLRIPAAIGDQFSNYEYDFDSESWRQNN